MTSDSPLVSIVVTSYNYAHYIGQTIASVLAQTYDNWELIISDDGSTDNSLEVIRTFSDPRITVIASETNRGGSTAYAEGYKRCHGKYFSSLDSDDYTASTKIEKQVLYLESFPEVDILGTFVVEVDANGQTVGDQGVHQRWFNQKIDLNLSDNWLWQNHLCHSSALVRKSFHDRIGLTNPNLPYTADYEFWVRCHIAGGQFQVLPEKLTYYRAHGRNETDKNPDRAFLESIYIFSAYLKPYLFDIHRQDLVSKSIADFLVHHEMYLRASKEHKATILKMLLPMEAKPLDVESLSQGDPSSEYVLIEEVLDRVLIGLRESTNLNEQQQHWIKELESGKAWLEQEWKKWQHVATEHESLIQRQQAAIEEQQATIQQQQTAIQQQQVTIEEQQATIQRLSDQ